MTYAAKSATAFAPATVGNAAVGFDLLGFCLDVAGDEATVRVEEAARAEGVEIGSLSGLDLPIPRDATQNTAGVALQAMQRGLNLPGKLILDLKKGIPLGSGMGGSAASAVAAVVAANALLENPADNPTLLAFALEGEKVASGTAHPDNAAPCLFGGLCAVLPNSGMQALSLPIPSGIQVVLVHPHLSIRTEDARAALSPQLSQKTAISQMGHLLGFVAGAYSGDLDLIGRHLRDEWIEPQRKSLIPGFDHAKEAAMKNGALGFSIAGAGPSVFAWARSNGDAMRIRDAVVSAFAQKDIATDAFVAPISEAGARVVHAGGSAS
jgi:homoserine kinase